MIAITQFLALLCASLFAGAALYGSLVESRATLALAGEDPAAQFVRGFRAAGAFQAPLVLVGAVAGVTAAVLSGGNRGTGGDSGAGLWIAGAALMVLVVVVTGVLVFPVNARLLNPEQHLDARETGDRRGLVIRWYRLHALRGLLALAAAILFLLALVQAR